MSRRRRGVIERPRRGPRPTDTQVLAVVAGYAVSFVVFGLAVSGPAAVVRGLGRILTTRDVLITDYVVLGGLGAAFVNAGLLTLLACGVFRLCRARMDGSAVASLFLVLGFALFGKNLLNVWPGLAGSYLYARWQREPFARHISTAFFGTALAPVFSEVLFSTSLALAPRLALGLGTSVVIGFALPPVARQLFRAHDGFSLYNTGFTAGLVATVVLAVYRAYGFIPEPVMLWSSGNDAALGAFLGVLFAATAVFGLLLDPRAWRRLGGLHRISGRSPSDFIEQVGPGTTLLNMAITGAIGTGYVLAVGGELNGGTVGAIFSIVGFAAFGKHTVNIVPVMAGVFLASLAKPWSPTDPSILFAALFGTTLAPIAGRFGPFWGVLAGFLHSATVLTVAGLHGSLNLYNNGFAAGIVASVLVPVIVAVSRPKPGSGPPANGESAVPR